MDLPTCPSCGQSVLDDDAQECPFCGASMTGAPVKKTGAKPPQSTEAKKSAEKKRKASSPAKPSEDDPFGVDTTAAQRAIPLHRKPSKGRMFRVVCPMCETNGFTGKKAAGRDVRCANPECLVPIFTAPKPDEPESKKAPAEETTQESASGSSAGAKLGVTVVAAVLIGGAIWYFGFSSGPAKQGPPSTTGYDSVPGNSAATVDATQNADQDADATNKADTADSKTASGANSLADLRKQSLEAMVVAARQRGNNRSKPLCRRLAAEAFAISGDLAAAAEQRQQLAIVGVALPYYQVSPLCTQAWVQLQNKKTQAATATVDEAWKAGQKLPKVGQTAAELTIDLAAVLVALGRQDDAHDLIQRQKNAGPFGQLAALMTDIYSRRSFDVDDSLRVQSAVDLVSPLRAAAIRMLVARGQSPKALQWTHTVSDVEARTEALGAWAIAAARAGQGEAAMTSVQTEAAQLPAASQALILAQLTLGQIAANDREGATKTIAAAQAAIAAVKPANPLTMPDMKRMDEFQLPDITPLRAIFLAQSEIAHVLALLGKTDEATTSLAAAMQTARGMSPGPVATRDCVDQIEQSGSSFIKSQLQSVLGIKSADELNIALRRYRKQCQKLDDAAQTRFQLQAKVLTRAIDWGLSEAVWNEVVAHTVKASSTNDQEPYLQLPLPVILSDVFAAAGDDARVQEIKAALQGKSPRAARHKLELGTWKHAENGDVRRAAAGVNSIPGREDDEKAWKWVWSMKLVCRLVNAKKTADALTFTTALKDPVLREDLYRLVAALATKNGDGSIIADFIQKNKIPFTEEVTARSGIVLGATAAMENAVE